MEVLFKKIFILTGVIAASVLAGILLDKFVLFKNAGSVDLFRIHPSEKTQYKFINPLLGAELMGRGESLEYKALSSKVKSYIDEKKERKEADEISYYFFDLEQGRWVGVDENNEYNAASLFKVPVMMAYFKAAAQDAQLLSKTVYVDSYTAKEGIEPSVIKAGKYTIDEIISDMIIYSDNKAKDILLTVADKNLTIDYKSFENVFTYLGVFNNGTTMPEMIVSPKVYSLFFRVLYNSTLLSKDMSEKALTLLSQAEFKEGLVAGIGDKAVVSHKFGYYIDEAAKKEELHDCGIVYYPNHPYFVCVMTRGGNLASLKEIIKNISQKTFEYMENQFGN